jgi:hypothetical protein
MATDAQARIAELDRALQRARLRLRLRTAAERQQLQARARPLRGRIAPLIGLWLMRRLWRRHKRRQGGERAARLVRRVAQRLPRR